MDTFNPSRRNLLALGAAGLGAALTSRAVADTETVPTPTVPSADAGRKATYKLSLAGYSFRKHLDGPGKRRDMSLHDLVDFCAKLGLDGVETTSYYFFSTDDQAVYDLKRHTYLSGLVNTGLPIGSNFALPDGPQFDRQIKEVEKWVDIAAKLGAPNMRVFAGKHNPQMSREEVFEQVVKGFKRTVDYAGSKGVFLALENHGFMTETAENVISIVKAVDHPWMSVNLDTGNFHSDNYEEVRKLAPHAVVCQFKTLVSGSDPGKQNKVPADYSRLFQILREVNYRGTVALEYEGDAPHKDIPIEIEKMRAALA